MKQEAPSPLLAEGASLRLCDTIARLRYEDLPREAVRVLKALIIDELAVIGGAARAPGIPELHRRLTRWEGGGSATALTGKQRMSPPSAAMANGAAGHALDFDDQHDPARVHTNCVTLPALLATAEDRGGVKGTDFLLAYAISAELHARFGLACYNSLGKGWHPTMVFGTLSATLGAGRLLGLEMEGLNNALGFAFHQASGSAQSMRDGVLSKRIGAGFAARAAVLGAFLGADGLTGTRRTLEGNAGLFALYERDEVRPELLFDRLGSDWRILEYSFKPFPCCRCNHTAIGLGIGFQAAGVRPDQVESIEIRMGNVNWMTVGEPYDPGRDSVVHAQFNAAYGFARALSDGKVDLRSYVRPGIADPAIAALAARITVVSDPAIEATAIEPARVIVRLKDSRTLERASDTIKGSPQEPLTEAELLEKFHSCLEFGLGAGQADARALLEVVNALEHSDDVGRDIVAAFPQPRDWRTET